jgi:phage major head subunit gpT-like protein
MPLTRSDISGLLLAGLKTQFFTTFKEQESDYEKICTIVPSDKDTEHYAWLGALPSVREFIDERQVGEFSEYEYQIKNKTWESTIAVDRAAIEDDQYGQVGVRVKALAMEARAHLDQLAFGLLANGFTANCYDGTPFFGTHPLGKNSPVAGQTQSNTVTDGLAGTSLTNAITAMRRTLNDQGRPMGIQPDTLVVPPDLEWEAWSLLNSIYHVDPVISPQTQNLASNPLRGMLRIVSTPYLTSPSQWFVLDSKRAVRAIVLQMRREFEFTALESNSEEGFMRDQYLYGVRGRYNVGFGDWRSAYGSLGTT